MLTLHISLLSMGCGCSNNARQVNPVESPSSTPEPGWLTSNGIVATLKSHRNETQSENGSQNGAAEAAAENIKINCGVDTSSLNSMLEYNNKKPHMISTGTQCHGILNTSDAAVNTSEQQCFSRNDTLPDHMPVPSSMLTPEEEDVDESKGKFTVQPTSTTESTTSSSLNNDKLQTNHRLDSEVDGSPQKILVTQENVIESKSLLTIETENLLNPATPEKEKAVTVDRRDDDNNKLDETNNNANDQFEVPATSLLPRRCNVGIQTDITLMMTSHYNDIDDVPEFAPRPPRTKKIQLMENCNVDEIDFYALQTPEEESRTIENLVNFLKRLARSDLEIVRAFYVWITYNIRYEIKFADLRLSTADIMNLRIGVARDYCNLFSEMCRLVGIRTMQLSGFAKGYDYKAGYKFEPKHDGAHRWNAVFLNGSWRLLDCTWGAGFINTMGRFQQRFIEHFFLTDPEAFIWTHLPYNEIEINYFRWQLLESPVTLEEFNGRHKVTQYFFQYKVKIKRPLACPVVFNYSTELTLSTPEVMRYKYKLFNSEHVESNEFNQYVFCHLQEDRLLGSFVLAPPDEGSYILKIYAHPEHAMKQDTILNCVIMFALKCVRTWKNVPKYPSHDMPWGPTRFFAEYGLKMINQFHPIVVIVSGRKTLMVEKTQDMLFSQQLFDVRGVEVPPKGTLLRDDSEDKIVKFVIQPPNVAFYKLVIYACPKPQERAGRHQLPCVATFAIDCKQSQASSSQLRELIFLRSKNGKRKNN